MHDRVEVHTCVLPAAAALVTEPPVAAWLRRLGPLAWVALEHLALSSHLSDQGWVAPVGVRDVATGINVTKDTAARAVATLRTAGLVVFAHVESQDGHKRSGYQIHLPEPLKLSACPIGADSLRNRGEADCPEVRYKDLAHAQIGCIPNKDGNRPRRSGRRPPSQLHLFDETIPSTGTTTREKA